MYLEIEVFGCLNKFEIVVLDCCRTKELDVYEVEMFSRSLTKSNLPKWDVKKEEEMCKYNTHLLLCS